jgi:hypothetical protein
MQASRMEGAISGPAESWAGAGAIRRVDPLIATMERSGAWPSPELLEKIGAFGEHAVMPLAGYIRGALMGVRSREPLPVAIRLLGSLRSELALTALHPLLRDCSGENLEAAAEAVSQVGPEAADRALEAAMDESLPLSNRVAALDAACGAASSSARSSRALGGLLHTLLRAELENGEWMSRSRKQWASAVVEAMCGLGYEQTGSTIREAVDCGILLSGSAGCELDVVPFVDSRKMGRGLPSFAVRYRGEYNMRSLRASSLVRDCNPAPNDLGGWSADFGFPG